MPTGKWIANRKRCRYTIAQTLQASGKSKSGIPFTQAMRVATIVIGSEWV